MLELPKCKERSGYSESNLTEQDGSQLRLGLKQANPVSVFWRSAVLGNGHTFPGLISSANPTRGLPWKQIARLVQVNFLANIPAQNSEMKRF